MAHTLSPTDGDPDLTEPALRASQAKQGAPAQVPRGLPPQRRRLPVLQARFDDGDRVAQAAQRLQELRARRAEHVEELRGVAGELRVDRRQRPPTFRRQNELHLSAIFSIASLDEEPFVSRRRRAD